jgi:hypothetical protein
LLPPADELLVGVAADTDAVGAVTQIAANPPR